MTTLHFALIYLVIVNVVTFFVYGVEDNEISFKQIGKMI
ncbi:hypothetical protein Premu_2014 [Hallella multisaccharivorax DSM 17128]|uniref:Uncharacterized protein n=1 Tax=Hallella multisaccharivorax DSM 17128 TaxID=688246 RepID=F8N796_9BACT|nr:hypothetical protein Premu_2014 [Hallella multisaccharivorax DSM 17128]